MTRPASWSATGRRYWDGERWHDARVTGRVGPYTLVKLTPVIQRYPNGRGRAWSRLATVALGLALAVTVAALVMVR